MNPALRALQPYPMVELQRRKAELAAAGKALFDFGTGDPIEPTPTFIREALMAAVPTVSQYPTVAGTPPLRSAVADYVQRRFAVSLSPEQQILPSAGSKEAIFHLPLAFIDPSSEKTAVIFGTPGYPVYEAGTLFAGGQPFPVTLSADNGFRLELCDIAPEILKRCAIVWINYPHNPTGAGIDLAYLKRQVAVCQSYDIILASDECYVDLWFDEQASPPPSLLQVGPLDRCLVFHSCSKRSGMTGYRSGFIAGDSRLIGEYRRWRAAMGVGSPAFVEAAATAAWADDEHAQQRRSIFTQKYDLLRTRLHELGCTVLSSFGGLYIWARIPSNFASSTAYAQACLDQGIVISPGGFFGEGGEGWFRLALVPSLVDCQAALTRWPR